MVTRPRLSVFGTLRRPRSRAVDAGYTMARAALVAALVFVAVTVALSAAQYALAGDDASFVGVGSYAALGLVAIVFVVPSAFVAGAVTWRWLVPEGSSRLRGALGGLVTVVETYLLSALPLSVLFAGLSLVDALRFDGGQLPLTELFTAVSDSLLAGMFFVVFAFLFSFWAAIPVGALAGWRLQRHH